MRTYFRTAPSPYSDRRNLPRELRSLPWALLATGNWPQFPEGVTSAVANMRDARVSPQAYFLPIAAANHPYTGAYGAVHAVRDSQAQLSAFRGILSRYLGGQSLTSTEARAILSLRMPCPQDQNAWNAVKRASNPCYLDARQISYNPRYAPPTGVMRIMRTIENGDLFNPAQMLSTAGSRAQHATRALATAELNRSSGPANNAVQLVKARNGLTYAVPVTMVSAQMPRFVGPPRTATKLSASYPPYVPPLQLAPTMMKTMSAMPSASSPTQRRLALRVAASQQAKQTFTRR
jgi:hypothetical protein